MTINTKYSIGDEVFFMNNNKVVKAKITFIRADVSHSQIIDSNNTINVIIEYILEDSKEKSHDRFENCLFPTKQALLDSL